MSLNKVTLIGRLVKDVELKNTAGGTVVANFTLAVNRQFTKAGEEKQADFLPVITFAKSAEFASKHFVKGQQVYVVGRVQTRTWEKDGVKQYVTEVIGEELGFADTKKTDTNTSSKAKNEDNDEGVLPF
jgi:single-strand DNA-binding protein